MKKDVCVVGGAGHVGAPLAIVLASKGLETIIYDINANATKVLASGKLPFLEEGGEVLLGEVLKKGTLHFSSDPASVQDAKVIILTIGTPIDEFHNPSFSLLTGCIDQLLPYLSDDQTIVLRSTVAPGVTTFLDGYLKEKGKKTGLAFCPERVVQGKAIEEIQTLPQLVSGTSREAVKVATDLFGRIAPEVVEMTTHEAEFAKLICNAFRYIQFAATNQLYMMVESAGINYSGLLAKMKKGYPRMGGIPGPGFAAGPCLMKDTMQLFAFEKHNFVLGQIAMMINEGLPNFIVENLAKSMNFRGATVGILGMAFKGDSDDIRDALSYKLLKILRFSGAKVLCSDEFVKDESFVSKERLLAESEVVVVGVPHTAYKTLAIPQNKKVVDMWNILPRAES